MFGNNNHQRRANKPLRVVAELDDIKHVDIVKLLLDIRLPITFNCHLSFAAHIDSTLSSIGLSQRFYFY